MISTFWLHVSLCLGMFRSASAHVALWNPGMYAFNGTSQTVDYNTNHAVNPLRQSDNLSIERWFGHGDLNLPPRDGDFMDLYPGQSAKFEISCNRQFTKYRDPTNQSPLGEYACDTVGPLHTVLNFGEAVDDSKFGGCALAIAYESDVKKLKPEDFTIFSVNHSCVWYREISFEVPQDLPECDDEKGCHCTWNWIHTANNQNAEGRGEGYPFEMYQNMYRCRINNATGVQPVLTGKVAAECINGNGTETSGCLDGPKTPFVWSQAEGDNIVSQTTPLYNMKYGFQNGAQNDIFDTKPDDDDDDNDDKDDNDKDKDEDEGEAKKDEDQKEGKPEDASGQPPYSPHESIDETGWAVPEISIGIPLVGSTLGFFLGRV